MNAGAERFTEKQEASKVNGYNSPRPRVEFASTYIDDEKLGLCCGNGKK